MSRYLGQNLPPTQPISGPIPNYDAFAPRRSRGFIAGTAVAALVALGGGFVVGRATAPERDATNSTTPAPTTTAPATTAPSATAPSPTGGAGAADELVTQGLTLHQAGRLDDAAALYNQALAKDPKNKFALFNLGQIAHGRQEYAAAIEKYKASLAVDAKYQPALYNIGLAYAATGALSDAISSLRKAAEVAPNNAAVMFNLGTLLIQDGKNDEGTLLIAQAIALDPTLTPKN